MPRDNIVVLERIDPKSDLGLLDPQVFKGGNALHVTLEPLTSLWRFKMERGLVPAPLRDKYTSRNEAIKQATQYFATKSVRIKEII